MIMNIGVPSDRGFEKFKQIKSVKSDKKIPDPLII